MSGQGSEKQPNKQSSIILSVPSSRHAFSFWKQQENAQKQAIFGYGILCRKQFFCYNKDIYGKKQEEILRKEELR